MFQEDLSIFFSDFAEDCAVTFEDTSKTNFTFKGIFEDPYAATQLGTYRVVISEPTLLVEFTDQIESLRRNDRITINERVYIVLGKPESDGTGTGRIKLAEVELQDGESEEVSKVPPPSEEQGLYE